VGAVDSQFDGQDAGQVAGLEELLEIPILNDLVMVLGSLSQVLSQNTLQSCLVSLFQAVSWID
jgi:hypothetical protein